MQTPRTPKHPAYQTYPSRLESFVSWPGRYVPKTPDELASAGFFYIGSADRVTCYQCGITLRDWEEEHDPVTEHRRYSPNCQFINQVNPSDLGVKERSDTDRASTSRSNVDKARSSTSESNKNDETSDDPERIRDTVDESDSRATTSDLGEGACARPPNFRDQTQSDGCHLEGAVKTRDKRCTEPEYLCEKLDHVCIQVTDQSEAIPEGVPDNTVTEEEKLLKEKISRKKRSSLLAENRRLKEQALCKRCKGRMASILFLPCGHLITCSDCAPKVEYCINCQGTILGTVKTFRA